MARSLHVLRDTVRRNLFGVLTACISFGILLFFLFWGGGAASLSQIAAASKLEWLLLAIGCCVLVWLLEGVTLHLFCRALYKDWRLPYSVCTGLIGILYSCLTPFSTGGQPMQIYTMHRLGMDTGKSGSIIAIKTLVYQGVLLVLTLVTIVWKLPYFQKNVSDFSFVTILGLLSNSAFLLFVALFFFSPRITDRLLRGGLKVLMRLHLCRKPLVRYSKIHRELSSFHGSSKLFGKNPRLYLLAIFVTVVQILLGCMVPYLIYRTFGFSEVGPDVMVAAQAYVSMVSAFVPLPGASGGAEGSFYLFFSMFFTGGTIVPAMVLWRAITYYMNIAAGAVAAGFVDKLTPIVDENPLHHDQKKEE